MDDAVHDCEFFGLGLLEPDRVLIMQQRRIIVTRISIDVHPASYVPLYLLLIIVVIEFPHVPLPVTHGSCTGSSAFLLGHFRCLHFRCLHNRCLHFRCL